MENATDALKIAFAAFIFVMALTIAITMFSNLNRVSQTVLSSSDITKYYTYDLANDEQKNRIVGLENIIPTLYKYYKENYTVLFLDKNGERLELYKSKTYVKPGESDIISTFDMTEEINRNEPWTGTIENYKKNLDVFLGGGEFYYPNGQKDEDGNFLCYDYGNGFIANYSGDKFKEYLGEYVYDLSNEENDDNDMISSLLKNKKKRVIIYQLQ